MTTARYPRYRLITGPDDDQFCSRVSEALELGYELYGSPAITVKGDTAYVAQGVIWLRQEPTPDR